MLVSHAAWLEWRSVHHCSFKAARAAAFVFAGPNCAACMMLGVLSGTVVTQSAFVSWKCARCRRHVVGPKMVRHYHLFCSRKCDQTGQHRLCVAQIYLFTGLSQFLLCIVSMVSRTGRTTARLVAAAWAKPQWAPQPLQSKTETPSPQLHALLRAALPRLGLFTNSQWART